MKVCLAQVQSERGKVQRNVEHHMAVLRTLEPGSADLVVFPELSLSNYDPDIAGAVALEPDDDRLRLFSRFAGETRTTVAVGAPLRTSGKPLIAMLVFAPGQDPVVIGKRHLHPDEFPYFSPPDSGEGVLDLATRIGVAICYEISVAEHTADVMAREPALYLASVAKTPGGVATARSTLAETARRHRVPALMVNSVGMCEGQAAGGGSVAIDPRGRVLAQLGGSAEGLLIFDTETLTATVPEGLNAEIALLGASPAP